MREYMHVHVCISRGGQGASECACLQGSPSPTPICLCSRRKQDTLSLICTSGASKPQPRQRVVGGGGPWRPAAQVYASMHVRGQHGGVALWPSARPPRKAGGVEGAGPPPPGGHRVRPSDHRPAGGAAISPTGSLFSQQPCQQVQQMSVELLRRPHKVPGAWETSGNATPLPALLGPTFLDGPHSRQNRLCCM